MKHEVKTGQVDYSVLIFIPDSASTDGSGKTGLVAANLTVSGVRVETDNDVTVTDYTGSLNNLASLTAAHADWGLFEVSSTLAPGLYRLDIADAIFAAGAWSAVVYVMVTTSAAAASPMEFVLIPQAPIDGVLLAPTTHTSAVIPTVTTVNGLAANVITAASIAADASTAIRSLASGTADSGGATTLVDAARTESDTDYWKGARLVFTSGNLLGQSRVITEFNPATDTLTFSPGTTQPVGTHTYEIWPAAYDPNATTLLTPGTGNGQIDLNSGRVNVGKWLSTVPFVLDGQNVQTSVNSISTGVITANSIAADAITDAKVASDVTIASVTGAVGSVTGNVGGNLTGTIGGLTAAALKDFFDTDSTTTYASAVAGSVVKEIADNAGGSALTEAGIATAVWTDLLASSDFSTASSIGKLLKDDVDATISSRMATYTQPTGFLAATFPTTVASTTNITAGTITTVTNLTNAATAGDLTATMKASVNTEIDTALADVRLDELLAADSDIDGAAPPTVGSVFHELLTKTAGSFTYDQTTDSLEAIRDRGDAAWTTATGFSTHSAADVWAVGTRVLTAGTNIVLAKGVGVTGFNDIAATDIVSAGAITTLSGAVVNVDTVDTLTTYTGNTPQTGDSFARLTGTGAVTFASLSVTGTTTFTGATTHTGQVLMNDGLAVSCTTLDRDAVNLLGNGAGDGLMAMGGATGHGARLVGGSTSGNGLHAIGTTLGFGAQFIGIGSAKAGIASTGGTNSSGVSFVGSGTGHGMLLTSGSGATGNGLQATSIATNGSGIGLTSTGTGSGLTADEITVSGTTTFTGAVNASNASNTIVLGANMITSTTLAADAITDAKVAADVTIASVTGSVGSVTGTVGGIAGTTQTLDSLQTALNSAHGSGSWATATGFSTHSAADVWAVATRTLTAATNITSDASAITMSSAGVVGTVTTVTNLTNAATAGDLTATMKASINTEVDTALVDIHLDHLLAVDYDPAAKPGVATALLNELIGSDAGVSQFTANALELAPTGGSAPTVGQIADAVWDEILSGHLGVGSTGEALNAAGAAGDPWITALPGAYGAGSAGKIVGDNINATISSRATQASLDTVDGIVDAILIDTAEIGAAGAGLTALATQTSVNTIDDFLDTEIAAIKAKTDNLPADPADASDIAASFTTVNTKLDTIDDFLDTEIAAILADTNELQTDWVDGGRLDLILDARSSQASLDALVTTVGVAGAGLTAADDAVIAAIAALNNLSAAAVNAEVVDALNVDTYAEIGQEAPAATTTLRKMIAYLYKAFRNKKTQSATEYKLFADNGTTVDQKATVSDDGTTTTIGELGTGP